MSQIITSQALAIKELLSGKPVAVPTETVYGLAAPIDNIKAIKMVFAMKNRPMNHPLIMHVHPSWDIEPFVEKIPDYAQILIKTCWPGPLTLVMHAKPGRLHPLITGGQPTVAIRSPNHPVILDLLEAIGTPLVAPSANPFGKISPTTAEHVQQAFLTENLYILDGGRCSVGIESTIIDATNDDYYQILRPGLLSQGMLKHYISTSSLNIASDIRIPGKLEQHYQPEKPLYYFETMEDLHAFCLTQKTAVFVLAPQEMDHPSDYFYLLSPEPEKAAYELYFLLRKADSSDASCLAIILPPDTESFAGVRERIIKAGMIGAN